MKSALAASIILALATPALGADHKVRMLNYGAEGGMVFEPAFVMAEPGDTITFVPENSGHYVQSYAVPDGVDAWKSKIDETYVVNLDAEGVYLYVCPPHLMMAMIGVVQVGRAANLEAVREKAAKLRPKLVMKGERLEAYLGLVAAK